MLFYIVKKANKKSAVPRRNCAHHLFQSFVYSSTAACAAANGNWLSAHYGESGKHLGNIMSMYCTFCTRFPQNIRPFLPLRLLVSIFLLLNTIVRTHIALRLFSTFCNFACKIKNFSWLYGRFARFSCRMCLLFNIYRRTGISSCHFLFQLKENSDLS